MAPCPNLNRAKVALQPETTRLVIEDCVIDGPSNFGLVLRSVQGAIVRRNLIQNHCIDDLRVVAGCRDVLVEDNAIVNDLDAGAAHKDLFQMFGISGQGIPRGITIRRNILHSNPPTSARQGLFITDPNNGEDLNAYTGIFVEQNYIWSNNKNTLVLKFCHDDTCIARHNTLRGSGNWLVHPAAKTTGNLINQTGDGLPNSTGDVIYKGMTGVAFEGTGLRERLVPMFDAQGAGCTELVAHLAASKPHGLDLLAA